MTRVTFGRVADLAEADRAAIRALSEAVYPPGDPSAGPSSGVDWARPERCVLVYAGDELVSCVGVVIREGTYEDRQARIGGIGGVKTHPAARRKGYAEAGIQRAIEAFHEEGAVFGLLVCRPALLDYYGRRGWHAFDGELIIRQRGEPATFTFNRVMTLPVREPAPTRGRIDLCGEPW